MKKTATALLVIAVLAFAASSAFAFGEANNSPNANATVYRTLAPERQAISNFAGNVRRDVRNAVNAVGERVSHVERTVDEMRDKAENFNNTNNGNNAYQNTVDQVTSDVREGYDSFRENFTDVVRDRVDTVREGFHNKMSDVSRRTNDAMRNHVAAPMNTNFQNARGRVSEVINRIVNH